MTSLQRLCLQWASTLKNSKVSPVLSSSSTRRRSTFSDIKCPSYDGFVEDNEDRINYRKDMWEEMFKQTSYFFDKGLRHVYPYYHTYHVNVKQRWEGHSLEHAFNQTFYAISDPNWVRRDVKDGSLTINGCATSADHLLRKSDKIQHTVHRHELPVTDFEVEILHIDSHMLVVNKPPGIPIHPTGRYQHNTLLYILAREFKLLNLNVLHRLDMGTSGVLLLPRSRYAADFFSKQMMNRKALKSYVARVVGRFPSGVIDCEQPLAPLDARTRIMRVHAGGKPSKTTFESLGYNANSDTSVVLCKPHTGRTHQVRVHLQYLGFPIHNDPLYNNLMFGPNKAKGGEITNPSAAIIKWWESDRSRWKVRPGPESVQPDDIVFEPWAEIAKGSTVDAVKAVVDPHCEVCPLPLIINKKDLGFHLHALEYKGSDWCFSSPMPDWAYPEWEQQEAHVV